jgi:hypothetical protein
MLNTTDELPATPTDLENIQKNAAFGYKPESDVTGVVKKK